MDIQACFNRFIGMNELIQTTDRVLLAVSGGRDSMLMTRLFLESPYTFAIAHCNFKLRGEESDADEALVRNFAEQHNIKLFVKHFDTESFAKRNKISIQMAARDLRYAWFSSFLQKGAFQKIAIAQHHNDQIETVFVNLLRGTGIKGLHGIATKKEEIIRPLLFLTANDVKEAVNKYEVPYRDDMSNFSTDYLRNKIRLDIIPQFEALHPQFEDIMASNIERFSEEAQLLDRLVHAHRKELFVTDGGYIKINKEELSRHIGDIALIYQLFRPFGYSKSVLNDMIRSWDSNPGAVFSSPHYQLLLDRDYVFLRSKIRFEADEIIIQEGDDSVVWLGKRIKIIQEVDKVLLRSHDIAQLDRDKVVFPLKVRIWKKGDYFCPLGMQGKKKISDFLISQKIPLFEKESITVLTNGNGDIMWVIGYRIDNRYKMTESTRKVIKFVYQ